MIKFVPTFRVQVYGAPRVGKTTLIERMITDCRPIQKENFSGYTLVKLRVDGEEINMEFYEGEGHSRPHAVVGVSDINNSETFAAICPQLEAVMRLHMPLAYAVRNKSDAEGRDADETEFMDWCNHHSVNDYKTSATGGTGVRRFMERLSRDLFRDYIRDELLICQDITEKLLAYPNSEIFRQPVGDDVPDYYEVIKDPMDLTTVLSNLGSKKYTSVAKWRADVELIWSNCEMYNGQDAYKEVIEDMKRMVRKLSKGLVPQNIAAEILTVTTAMNKLIDKPPPNMRGILPPGAFYTQSEMKLPFTPKDLMALSEDVRRLEIEGTQDDRQQLAQVVKWFNLRGRPKGGFMEFDVSTIPDEAKVYVRSFLKERLSVKL